MWDGKQQCRESFHYVGDIAKKAVKPDTIHNSQPVTTKACCRSFIRPGGKGTHILRLSVPTEKASRIFFTCKLYQGKKDRGIFSSTLSEEMYIYVFSCTFLTRKRDKNAPRSKFKKKIEVKKKYINRTVFRCH